MNQPYPYWLLDTPLAYFVGLYTNVNNAGQLDDPAANRQPQFDWLVQTLKDIKESADGKAVLLALHYPPYSAAVNFRQRGDPNLGPTPRPADKILEPLGILIQRAFRDSGQYPDAVLSAHAHHYQRLTWTLRKADGRQIPFVVAGGGGHIPVEQLSKPCEKEKVTELLGIELEVVYPPGLSLPAREAARGGLIQRQGLRVLAGHAGRRQSQPHGGSISRLRVCHQKIRLSSTWERTPSGDDGVPSRLGSSRSQRAGRTRIRTVETYKARSLDKVGLHSRADLVRYSLQQGWLQEM